MTDSLANPAWSALTGPQQGFALGSGLARRYRDDIAPFGAVADDDDPAGWRELAELTDSVVVIRPKAIVPPAWTRVLEIPGGQYVYDGPAVEVPTADIVALGRADVPQMLELVELARPGPFREQTVDLGGYRGIRDGEKLIAMAGHRIQPTGWVEISAVCTHPDYRGQGLGVTIIQAVLADVAASGRRAFLHVAGINTAAAALYRKLGFTQSREVVFIGLTH
jgi:ribosomal protein S18 acetylase RimI-like enzyme